MKTPFASRRVPEGRRAMALLLVLQLMALLMIIGMAYMINGNQNIFFMNQERNSLQAFYASEAMLEKTAKEIYDRIGGSLGTSGASPFAIVDGYDGRTLTNDFKAADGTLVATCSVTASVLPAAGVAPLTNDPEKLFLQYKNVTLTATGTVGNVQRKVRLVVKVGLKPADCFDYSYYINNWGWWMGVTATVIGNTGANGNYLVQGGNLNIQGNPTYNPDGTVKSEAALQASANINVSPGSISGYGATHQQARAQFTAMPNLNNTDYYKNLAQGNLYAPRGSLKQGSTVLVDGVLTGTKESIVLDGTTNPIEISGPVYIPGNVVIKGTVKGKGTLYVGRNLYVAGSVSYGAPPSARPVYNPSTQTAEQFYQVLETWKTANASADAVTFSVQHNIVLGDHTSSWWWSSVGNWINASDPVSGQKVNDNHEDAGLDHVWSSFDGKENDTQWTVQVRDTATGEVRAQDFPVTAGRVDIPPNLTVIPGTGEDDNGDGKYTPPYTYEADFAFADSSGNAIAFTAENFVNHPGAASYGAYASSPSTIHGFLYTNCAIAGYLGGPAISIRGGMSARQDAMLLGGSMTMEHDERMTGVDQQDFGQFLPPVQGLKKMQWLEVTGL